MSTSIEALLPEWRAQPTCYMNKLLSVFKKGEHVNDISMSTKKDHIVFGRKKELCDVLLEHQSISRQHAVLFFGEMGSVYLMDLGSSHGTHVDAKALVPNEPHLLTPQSDIIFGQSSRSYRLCTAPKKPAVPLFTGKNVFDVPVADKTKGLSPIPSRAQSQAQMDRKQRQAEIAAMVQEMSNPVPVFESVQVNALNRHDLIKAREQALAQADEDGATFEFNENDEDGQGGWAEVDVAALEEVSDSEEEGEEEGEEEEEEEGSGTRGPRGAQEVDHNYHDDKAQAQSHSSSQRKIGETQIGEAAGGGGSMADFPLQRRIPISHQVDLRGHTRAVACISCEPAGNRLVTGSLDYSVKMYDFGGMDMRHRSFKAVEVQEGYPLSALAHTPSGDKFIACTGSCQPKIYSREGEEVITFVRGDMYLRDLSNTKGHTMEVTGAQWHPSEKGILLTSSMDGSLRVWDLTGEANFGNLCCKHVLKIRGKSGYPRVGARCCAYSLDGTKMIAGATDGTIHIWLAKKHYSRADFVIDSVNLTAGTATTTSAVLCVAPSPCNPHLYASRGEDGTLRLWEIPQKASAIKKPRLLRTFTTVHNLYPSANVAFSPDGSLLCCGTTPSASGEKAMLLFFDLGVKALSQEVPPAQEVGAVTGACLGVALGVDESAIFVQWQGKSNQIFCSSSAGYVRVFFDPRVSEKGAVITAARAPRREKDPSDYTAVGEIFNPHALPLYKQENLHDAKRKKAEQRKDPIHSKIPSQPIVSRGQNSNNQSFFFTKYVMEGRSKDTTGMEDPREALLKMDALAERDPIFFGRAYEKSQPVREMHSETFEQEQEQFKKRQKR